jgi:ATPase subunit of ABC transporter with duplicated ATPase domains
MGMIFISHDLGVVKNIADEILEFRVTGEIPLPGARFWASIDRIALAGPAGALDWRAAFEPLLGPGP